MCGTPGSASSAKLLPSGSITSRIAKSDALWRITSGTSATPSCALPRLVEERRIA
jgi:hypothetical protein